jgi:DtxR family Mn-dependent transcriptional regulator
MELSGATQDYLKSIYKLMARHGRASTTQIATRLNVSPASVTSMVQKMAQADPPLLNYQKHQGVTLTPAGEKAALTVVRQHRLLELFLQQELGYSWDEVHEEAERLEHVISPEMVKRIATVLDHPRTDPHGQPIPTRDLELLASTDCPLSELCSGQRAVIRRVDDEDADLLRYLDRVGLRPNVTLKVLERHPHNGSLRLQISNETESIIVRPRVTDHVFVDTVANQS